MSFFTRTNALDMHVMIRLDIRAKQITASNERDNERFGEDLPDIDGPPMRALANMFANHEDTAVISAWLRQQDTAFREMVPPTVFQILKDNTYE